MSLQEKLDDLISRIETAVPSAIIAFRDAKNYLGTWGAVDKKQAVLATSNLENLLAAAKGMKE